MMQHVLALEQSASATDSALDVWALILPAAVAAVFGILAGWIGAYLKVKAENYATKEEFSEALERLAQNTRTVGEENARVARRTALDSELREAVRQFTFAAGSAIHSMSWITWDFDQRGRVNKEMVTDYDAEMHQLFPTIIAQLAVIAMLNRDVYDSLAPFADEIIKLDGTLSSAMISEQQEVGSQVEALRRCYATAVDLEAGFRGGVANLFPDDARWSSSKAE